ELRDQAAHPPRAPQHLLIGAAPDTAFNRASEAVDTRLPRGDRLDDGHILVLSPQLEHASQLPGGAVGERKIRLVDHQHVGDLENAGLDGLDIVARIGRIYHDAHIRDLDDLDFRLTDADRLDDDEIAARGVHHIDDAVHTLGQAAEMTARCD